MKLLEGEEQCQIGMGGQATADRLKESCHRPFFLEALSICSKPTSAGVEQSSQYVPVVANVGDDWPPRYVESPHRRIGEGKQLVRLALLLVLL